LNEVIELDEDALLDAIEEAERSQLIRSTTRGGEAQLMVAHELIRQTLLSDLSTPRRQRFHLRVAEAMEQLYAGTLESHASDLAHHFYQGGGDSKKVIEYAAMAAERATAQTAYEEAVEQYQRAVQALEQRQPVDQFWRCDLLLLLGHAYGNAGNPLRAKETLLGVTEIARKLPAPEQFAEAVVRASRYWQVSGTIDNQFLNLVHEGLKLLGDKESALRATLLARLAADLELAQDEGGSRLSEQALAMARRIGDPKALYYALYARAFIWDRPLEERIADAAELAKMEEEVGSPEGKDWGLNFLCYLHRMQGDFVAAEVDLAALKRRAMETLNPDTIWLVSFAEATQAQMMGQFAEAERLAVETFSTGQKVNEATTAQMVAAIRYISHLLQGQLADADDELQNLLTRYPYFQEMPMFRIRKAWFHFFLGREEQAREEFERLAANNFAVLPRNWGMLSGLSCLSEIAAGLGDTCRATQLYDLLGPYGDRVITAGINGCCSGAASHWLGLLAAMLQRWDDAAVNFEDAIETNSRIGARPWMAQSQHTYARMLIERGDSGFKESAKRLLTDATATYRELGMPTFLEDAEELMKRI
jgi:tetratricopeptide (TPR) repeat protein